MEVGHVHEVAFIESRLDESRIDHELKAHETPIFDPRVRQMWK